MKTAFYSKRTFMSLHISEQLAELKPSLIGPIGPPGNSKDNRLVTDTIACDVKILKSDLNVVPLLLSKFLSH